MSQKIKWDFSSAGLHIPAMGLMLCGLLWVMLLPAEVNGLTNIKKYNKINSAKRAASSK